MMKESVDAVHEATTWFCKAGTDFSKVDKIEAALKACNRNCQDIRETQYDYLTDIWG